MFSYGIRSKGFGTRPLKIAKLRSEADMKEELS